MELPEQTYVKPISCPPGILNLRKTLVLTYIQSLNSLAIERNFVAVSVEQNKYDSTRDGFYSRIEQ